jgi:hypothetical protein
VFALREHRQTEEIALLGTAAPSKSKSLEDCSTKNPNNPDAMGSNRDSEQLDGRSARGIEVYEPNSSAD